MNCSMLPSDVLCLIDSKLDTAADRIRFRAVSKSLRSCLPFHQQPIWLILSEEEDEEELEEGEELRLLLDEDYQPPPKPQKPSPPRGIVPVGEQNIHHMDLPEAHGKRCVCSAGSWLVTCDYDGNICLLNPFAHLRIDLPSIWTFYGGFISENLGRMLVMNCYLSKVVFSTSDFINTKDWIAMAIYDSAKVFAIARPGDASWTYLDMSYVDCSDDIIYFQNQFHIVDSYGAVRVYDTQNGTINRITEKVDPTCPLGASNTHRWYLVEWMGELLLVKRVWSPRPRELPRECLPPQKTLLFKVFKRDFVNNKWIEISDLDEYCLFVGLNTSKAISTRNYTTGSLKRNSIYFSTADNCYDFYRSFYHVELLLADDIGVYSLEDESVQFLYNGICKDSFSPPLWIIPQLDQNL